jgi:uncharacterized membrane protein
MSAKRYFQLSLLLPLILPVIVLLLFEPSFANGGIVLILMFSLYFGALPYLLFVIGLLFWMRRKDVREIQRMTFIAPLVFTGFFITCVITVIPIQLLMIGEVRIEADVVFQCCVVILTLGYAYVLVANAGYAIVKALKLVKLSS